MPAVAERMGAGGSVLCAEPLVLVLALAFVVVEAGGFAAVPAPKSALRWAMLSGMGEVLVSAAEVGVEDEEEGGVLGGGEETAEE